MYAVLSVGTPWLQLHRLKHDAFAYEGVSRGLPSPVICSANERGGKRTRKRLSLTTIVFLVKRPKISTL